MNPGPEYTPHLDTVVDVATEPSGARRGTVLPVRQDEVIEWLSKRKQVWLNGPDTSGRAVVLALLLEFEMETGITL